MMVFYNSGSWKLYHYWCLLYVAAGNGIRHWK